MEAVLGSEAPAPADNLPTWATAEEASGGHPELLKFQNAGPTGMKWWGRGTQLQPPTHTNSESRLTVSWSELVIQIAGDGTSAEECWPGLAWPLGSSAKEGNK